MDFFLKITTLHIPQQNEVLKKKTLISALFPYPLSQRAGSEVEIVQRDFFSFGVHPCFKHGRQAIKIVIVQNMFKTWIGQ